MTKVIILCDIHQETLIHFISKCKQALSSPHPGQSGHLFHIWDEALQTAYRIILSYEN